MFLFMKKNKKNDVINISQKEWRDYHFEAFNLYFKNNLQGKSVINPVLGEIFFFKSTGAKETIFRNRNDLFLLPYIIAIPSLLKISSDVIEEEIVHDKTAKGVTRLWRVKGKIKVEGKIIRAVEVIVLEDKEHIKYYTFDARFFKIGKNSKKKKT